MKQYDQLFKEYSSEENHTTFGKEVFNILKLKIKSNTILRNCFDEALNFNILINLETYSKLIIDKLYEVWLEKLCNVRIKDRMAAMDLIEVSSSQKLSSKTQNLRDSLLSAHVKEKK